MMTDHEANDKLYEKMTAEQDKFRKWLLSLPPAEILVHAYEYSVREDVLCSLEGTDLDGRDARALLRNICTCCSNWRIWSAYKSTSVDIRMPLPI